MLNLLVCIQASPEGTPLPEIDEFQVTLRAQQLETKLGEPSAFHKLKKLAQLSLDKGQLMEALDFTKKYKAAAKEAGMLFPYSYLLWVYAFELQPF